MRKFNIPLSCLTLLLASCGGASNTQSLSQDSASVDTADTSTLTAPCDDTPVPQAAAMDLCKTLASGAVYVVTLGPGTYTQDPETCAMTSSNDGLRASMLEMGFKPCDEMQAGETTVTEKAPAAPIIF